MLKLDFMIKENTMMDTINVNQLNSTVIGKDDGESFWQPMRSNGYVTIMVSRWNIPNTGHTIFFSEIPTGGIVGRHYHDDQEEIFVCLSGKAIIQINDVDHEITPEMVAYIGKNTWHSIKSIGDEPFRAFVIISPAGLEERLREMGKPRILGESPPQPFETLAPKDSFGVVGSK